MGLNRVIKCPKGSFRVLRGLVRSGGVMFGYERVILGIRGQLRIVALFT